MPSLSLPMYTAEENLFSIEMQKRTKFILVEGPFDYSLYQEVIESVKIRNNLSQDKEILFGGGKQKISKWAEKTKPKNVAIIFDRDFDCENYDQNIRSIIFELKKYSIENYFFDKNVICNLLLQILKSKRDDIFNQLDLKPLFDDWNDKLSTLIPIVYYYQKIHEGNKEKWNNIFICEPDSYRLSIDRILDFKQRILNDMNVEEGICISSFDDYLNKGACCSEGFPGKILFESFYRYIKDICNSTRNKSFSSIKNCGDLKLQLVPRLSNNIELEAILIDVVEH